MKERVLSVSGDPALAAVLTEPAAPRQSETAVLLTNAGVIHRIGPHRLNVRLARAFAERSAPAARFDLSGLGDTPAARETRGYARQVERDFQAVMDAATRETGARRFVAMGLCSGADDSFRAALADERIIGVIALDPYAYRAPAAALEDFIRRAGEAERWRRKLFPERGAGGAPPPESATAAATVEEAAEEAALDQSREIPPRDAFGADLQRLADRNVRMLLIYSGFVRALVSRPAHFYSAFSDFDLRERVSVVCFPDAAHTYVTLEAQDALIATALDFAREAGWIEGA